MNVLLAGCSGMIGRGVLADVRANGHVIRQLVRRAPVTPEEVTWDPERGVLPKEHVEWADAVVSLNGASLTKLPWTPSYRRLILESRTTSTSLIAHTIAEADSAPQVWVSASAVGVYGDRPGETLTETSTNGSGFLADVVTAWEGATVEAADTTRVVLARTGVVLGQEGALVPVVRLARLHLSGSLGSGSQYWPWISLTDEVRAIVHLIEKSALSGPINLAAPVAATAGDITRAVAKALGRRHWLPAPAWALRVALGDAAKDLLLADQHVVPTRLTDEGTFQFKLTSVDDSVTEAIAAMNV